VSGWYDDGSAEQAEMEARLRRRQIEEAQENRRLESEQQRIMERQHELRCDAAEEMYEALKAILGYFESGEFIRKTTLDFEQGWQLKMIPVVKSLADAKAALAKAGGAQ
jgi:hypothetical protein